MGQVGGGVGLDRDPGVASLRSAHCASGDRLRADLLLKAAKGDAEAAERLLALDADFERDWWNGGPHKRYLEHDLGVLRKTEFADGRGPELVAAAEALLASTSEDGERARAATQVLKKAGFMLDEKGTLPQGPRLLPVMLDIVLSAKAISRDDWRAKWGEAILRRAQATHVVEAYRAAVHLYQDTEPRRGDRPTRVGR